MNQLLPAGKGPRLIGRCFIVSRFAPPLVGSEVLFGGGSGSRVYTLYVGVFPKGKLDMWETSNIQNLLPVKGRIWSSMSRSMRQKLLIMKLNSWKVAENHRVTRLGFRTYVNDLLTGKLRSWTLTAFG